MDNDQHKWARGELDKLYPDRSNKTRQAVTALLSVWTRVDIPLDGGAQAEAIDVFSKLALMNPLGTPASPEEPKRVWGSASQYATACRYARVRLDKVPAAEQWMYADRVGEIVGLRRGVISLVFLDARDGAPPGHQAEVHDFEVDIAHLVGAE